MCVYSIYIYRLDRERKSERERASARGRGRGRGRERESGTEGERESEPGSKQDAHRKHPGNSIAQICETWPCCRHLVGLALRNHDVGLLQADRLDHILNKALGFGVQGKV